MEALEKYLAYPEYRKRATLRGAAYEYNGITEYDNGCIIEEPRADSIADISPETLEQMDQAMEYYKQGITSEPIDFSRYKL